MLSPGTSCTRVWTIYDNLEIEIKTVPLARCAQTARAMFPAFAAPGRLCRLPNEWQCNAFSRRRETAERYTRWRACASPRPLASVLASGALRLLVTAVLTRADGIEVDVDAKSNASFLSGDIEKIAVTINALDLNGVCVSGGARLSTGRVRFGGPRTLLGPPRLLDPVSVSVSATLTEADLNQPGPVRSGLDSLFQMTLNAVMSGAAGRNLPPGVGPQCSLDYVRLDEAPRGVAEAFLEEAFFVTPARRKNSGVLVLESHVILESGRRLNFAVRGKLSIAENGTVVRMERPELCWRSFAIPIVIVESVGVQLMPLTTLSRLEIFDERLAVDGIVIVPPQDTFRKPKIAGGE